MIFERKLRDTIEGLRSSFLKIGDFNIHYVETGQPDRSEVVKSPLILIHGANIGWGQWHKNIKELGKYFKVYAIDLPGAGRSSRVHFKDMDMDATFLGVVRDFMRQKNIDKAHIVGHSVGGWVALKLAIENPKLVDKLILVNSLGFSDHVPWGYRPVSFYNGANLLSKTVMSPTRDNMRKFLSDVLYNKEGLSEQLVDYYHEAVTKDPNGNNAVSHPFMLINRLFKPFRIRDEFVLKDDLSKVSNCTLAIVSDNDPLLPFDKQREGIFMIRNVRLEVFKNTGHVPPMERSREFNGMVIDFLRDFKK